MLMFIFYRENANTLNESLFSFRDRIFFNILTLFAKSILLTVFLLKRSVLVTIEVKCLYK